VSFSGSGPGVQTRDGCSVELYRQLPYLGELDAVRDYLRAGSTILELGCGTGRLARVLLELGLQPACVDNSAEMLRHLPPGVTAVQSDVEALVLDRKFDAVLLASCLVNHPGDAVRDAFIGCAARHSARGSILLVERHDPEWLSNASAGWSNTAGPAVVHVDQADHEGALTKMRLRYVIGDGSWTQSFQAVALGESDIEDLLRTHGFVPLAWLGARKRWAVAAYDPPP
jgi:SAM-dependent methyltransferase